MRRVDRLGPLGCLIREIKHYIGDCPQLSEHLTSLVGVVQAESCGQTVDQELYEATSEVVHILRRLYPRVFYASPEWFDARYQALKLHGGTCQCCGVRASPGHPLHVDHIKPRSKFPELAIALDNLQVLCDRCNLGKSNKDETDWRGS